MTVIGRSIAGKAKHLIAGSALAALSFAPAPLSAQPQEVFANDRSFHYVERGSGPAVILVHGSVSDYREWSNQMEPLARRYHLVAYSRRYHWPNAAPGKDADATLERQAADLAAIIRALKLAPAHIVGHSYGGATALFLAREHPELVRTLVLAEPAVGGVLGNLAKDDAIAQEGQAVRSEMKQAFSSGDAQRIVSTYAARVAPVEFARAGEETRAMLLANIAAFELDFTSSRSAFVCDDARRIEVPTLVIAGGRSALGLQRIAAVLAGCLGRGRLEVIPEATHWMESDHPSAFNDAVLSFLEKN